MHTVMPILPRADLTKLCGHEPSKSSQTLNAIMMAGVELYHG